MSFGANAEEPLVLLTKSHKSRAGQLQRRIARLHFLENGIVLALVIELNLVGNLVSQATAEQIQCSPYPGQCAR